MRPDKSAKRAANRLREIGLFTPAQSANAEQQAPLLKRGNTASFARLEDVLNRLGIKSRLQDLLQRADSSSSSAKAFLRCLAISGATLLLASFFNLPLIVKLLLSAALGFAPIMLLRLQGARRLKAFNNALPECIDLMARALRAGRSVASAIEVIAEQGQEPVASEFAHVFKEQNFGLPFRESLMNMSRRIPSQDLQFLITAMLVQKETGGNLIDILDRTTHVIRERIRIHGEIRVKTAQGRLTGWILSLLPIVMGVLINFVNPGFEKPLFYDPVGKIMLYCGAGMLVLGGLIIRKIVDIEV
jgi:tight adherence protein B